MLNNICSYLAFQNTPTKERRSDECIYTISSTISISHQWLPFVQDIEAGQ